MESSDQASGDRPQDFAEPVSSEATTDSGNDRWSTIKTLFASALVLAPAERGAFLNSQCGSDDELRREIESLLAAHGDAGEFLEQPVASVKDITETEADPRPTHSEDALIGTRIGAYQLEQLIGSGGMGAVYLATRADSEYVKRVAIKLIRRGQASRLAISRFRNERQILATIEHPYVARLLDGGTTEAGIPYFLMEYVEGQSLTEYCETQSLTTQERLRLFLKVCSAVHYAHSRNVIHRDLKPSNILVQKDGVPKLLDFGIAKLLDPEIGEGRSETTLAGVRMLTPAYASPEQMQGLPATVRSDVYSLGVILYEMLCGERPGLGGLDPSPRPDRPLDSHLSPGLRAVLFKAIRLDPETRYQSINLFAADIQHYLDGAPLNANPRTHFDTNINSDRISIAILPFRPIGGESKNQAFLASGISDALITKLSRVQRLSVRPPSAVLPYTRINDVARAAKELRVEYLLEGSLYISDNQVRVRVQLVWSETAGAVWAASFDEPASDLLKLEDSIAEQVAYALIPQLTGKEREQLSKSGTANARAHEAYLRGRWYWSRNTGGQDDLAKALVHFMDAIALDPNYAKAHVGVADYYLRLGMGGGLPPSESFAAAMKAAETGLRLDSGLAEAHASFAFATWACHRDYATAEQHFQLAITRNPDYANAHHWFGLLNSARNRPELAIANLDRARQVDPNSQAIAAALGFVYYSAREYRQAVDTLTNAARELRNSAAIQEMLCWCHLQTGEAGKALDSARSAVQMSGRNGASLSALAHAQIACGDRAAAIAIRDEMDAIAQKHYVSGYDRASLCLALGEKENALKYLEQCYANGDWWINWIAVDPRWDRLRDEPRFTKLALNTQPSKTDGANDPQLAPPVSGRYKALPVVTATAIAILLALAISLFLWRRASRAVPFTDLKFTKLTTNGTADLATIAPDSQYIAYTTVEAGGTSLWLKKMSKAAPVRRLTQTLPGVVNGLSFTNNGTQVSFVSYPPKQPFTRHLYLVPVAGGAPRQILGTFSGPVTLSADGASAAAVRGNATMDRDELWIIDTATGAERMIASYKYPERFAWSSPPAWSHDKNLLGCAIEGTDSRGFFVHVVVIDTQTGSRRAVRSARWQRVDHMAWLGDHSALAVVGQEVDSSFSQIWYLPYPNGDAKRIGNDLDDYVGVSAGSGGAELVSVQNQTLSNIYLQRPGDLSEAQITAGSGRYFDLAWAPDGRLLYASDSTGSADIWVMNGDGTGERQLTSGPGRNYSPASSPDGKGIAFHSNRDGIWNIWRVDANGNHPLALTTGPRGGNWPQFTPDGKFVVYHRADPNGQWNIWKAPSAGGEPVQVTGGMTTHPAVSPRNGEIAAWYSETTENPQWKLAIFPRQGGEPKQVFDPPVSVIPDSLIRWTPSGSAITFLGYRHNAYNIWLQPVDGGSARPLTSFRSGRIYSFDWSRDGRLAYSRGMTTNDVVLIRDTAAK
jgi:Serine/threonine protein kinase